MASKTETVNPVDMEMSKQPDVTPLDGVKANVEDLEQKIAAKEAEYAKLYAEYSKVVSAFNALLDEYNALHVQSLLNKSDNLK